MIPATISSRNGKWLQPQARNPNPLRVIGGGENAEHNPARVQAARGASSNMLPVISWTATKTTDLARRRCPVGGGATRPVTPYGLLAERARLTSVRDLAEVALWADKDGRPYDLFIEVGNEVDQPPSAVEVPNVRRWDVQRDNPGPLHLTSERAATASLGNLE